MSRINNLRNLIKGRLDDDATVYAMACAPELLGVVKGLRSHLIETLGERAPVVWAVDALIAKAEGRGL